MIILVRSIFEFGGALVICVHIYMLFVHILNLYIYVGCIYMFECMHIYTNICIYVCNSVCVDKSVNLLV